MSVDISFIIPAYNEEKNIVNTITGIKKYAPIDFTYEILLVDHNSMDNTVAEAKKNGVNTYVMETGTIAGLRNYGVSHSSGDVIIFLDADISLTSQWNEKIGVILEKIKHGDGLLTGSYYSIPDNPTWIEKYWFKPMQKSDSTHINSGHMIISREKFNELSGFDENLETGEDYDISMRAKKLGMNVVDNRELKVIHEGFPKGLLEYMRREYWHGKGDAASVKSIVKSKVASLALFFSILHLILLFSLFIMVNINLAYICIFCIVLICVSASYVKFKRESLKIIITNSVIYYFYFLSRSASLLTIVFGRRLKKRQR